MTEKEIIKKLAEIYIELNKDYESGINYSVEKAARLSLLDEIFEEIFGIENVYVDNGRLMSEGKRI